MREVEAGLSKLDEYWLLLSIHLVGCFVPLTCLPELLDVLHR